MKKLRFTILLAIFLGLLFTHKCEASKSKQVEKPTTIKIYTGHAPANLKYNHFEKKVYLENDIVFGAGVNQKLDYEWSIDVIFINNHSLLMGLGFSF